MGFSSQALTYFSPTILFITEKKRPSFSHITWQHHKIIVFYTICVVAIHRFNFLKIMMILQPNCRFAIVVKSKSANVIFLIITTKLFLPGIMRKEFE